MQAKAARKQVAGLNPQVRQCARGYTRYAICAVTMAPLAIVSEHNMQVSELPLVVSSAFAAKGGCLDKHTQKKGHASSAQPELVVSSPLARALHTADLAFPASNVPRIMLPIARERLYLSSDVGQPRRGPTAHVLLEWLFPTGCLRPSDIHTLPPDTSRKWLHQTSILCL